jgi:hypothetical protein
MPYVIMPVFGNSTFSRGAIIRSAYPITLIEYLPDVLLGKKQDWEETGVVETSQLNNG